VFQCGAVLAAGAADVQVLLDFMVVVNAQVASIAILLAVAVGISHPER
jgi:hypothetical protein